MDRREVLKASLVGAASMGVPTNFSTGRLRAAEREVTAETAAAAGAEMPLVSVFGGFSCERMFERWRPDGPGPKRIIAVREQSVAELLRLTREAICEVTGRAS